MLQELKNFFLQRDIKGIKIPKGNKILDEATDMPKPKKVLIPMTQHIGAPCNPLVKKGDFVKVGQLIGDSEEKISAPIYSSVSGKVSNISEVILYNGSKSVAIEIESDDEMSIHESVVQPKVSTFEEFISAVRRSGVVGLGGAGFPTHFKLSSSVNKNIETLIINAAECEPFITSDFLECLTSTESIIYGILNVSKYLNIKKVLIGVESDKTEAIDKLNKEISNSKDLINKIVKNCEINVVELQTSYPQGAEKVLIYNLTKKKVGVGKLPADVGVLVMNVSTVSYIGKYLKTGLPLINKRITVTGNAISKSQNVMVPIGTPISDVADFCGGYTEAPSKIIFGGPMMGISVYSDSLPVTKQNNAILFMTKESTNIGKENPCIRCGSCVQTCPMSLMPCDIYKLYDKGMYDEIRNYGVYNCIECGNCSYGCPSKIPLTQYMRLAKNAIRKLDVKSVNRKEAK